MAKKSAKKAAAAKQKAAKRVPTNWARIKELYERGKSDEEIAKLTDAHYDPKHPDPTHSTRARISKARTTGVRINGKLVRFGQRGKEKGAPKKASNQKTGSKTSKTAKSTAKVVKPAEPKTAEQAKVEPTTT
jgi:hypothetical protein